MSRQDYSIIDYRPRWGSISGWGSNSWWGSIFQLPSTVGY